MQRLRPYVLVVCALLSLFLSGLATAFFHNLLSLRFSALGRDATGEVAIVAIDAPSLAAEGVWPWPRTLHARLIDRLLEAGASEIAFDVDFSAASSTEHDEAFENALRRAGGSVALPTFKQFASSGGLTNIFVSQPLPRFAGHAWPAAVNVRADSDGIVRRYTIGQMLPSGVAPSLAAFVAGRGSISDSSFLVDFGIRASSVPIVSFVDVLNHVETFAALKGKRVIVGATAVELGDRVTVPGGRIIPGVMLQALAAESLLQRRDLTLTSGWVANGSAVIFALLIAILLRRVPVRTIAALLIAIPIASEAAAYALQALAAVVLDTAPLHLVAMVWAVVIAIEELNLRELLRRIAERRFNRVSMSIADGLICTDGTGRITLWNPAAQRMFGFEAREILGLPISSIICRAEGEAWTVTDVPLTSADASIGAAYELLGKRRDGSTFLIEVTLAAWETAAGQNHSVAVRDISIRKREEERIRYLAEHDTLTGLLNRRSLIQNLEARVVVALDSNSEVALLLIDIDRFQEFNDTLGHAAGDQILHGAASKIADVAGVDATVARLGGDEFAVIISAPNAASSAKKVSQAIVDAFARHDIEVHGSVQNVAASIGVAIYPQDSDSAEDLMADADLAIHHTKSTGGGSICFFSQALRDEFEQRVLLAEELTLALARGEFELHYQPQIDLNTRAIVGVEALIRWRHPERGLVAPGHFIPLLNSLPISNDVSIWTLRTACQQACEWRRAGRNIRVGVNLAPAQFRTMDLPAVTALVLAETGLPAHLLELEVTEEIVIEDDAAAAETFRRLRALGVQLAWDDFGTGYGSLIYLKKFPLNRLKIDQSFVRDLKEGTLDFAIVENTIRLSKMLGLSITAEGIEQPDVVGLLTRMGCDEGQGYFFAKPAPALGLFIETDTTNARNVA